MSLPPRLEDDLARLQEQGHTGTAHRDLAGGSRICVVFERYPLPPGWNRTYTDLLIITDVSYPNSKLDMFWTNPGLQLSSGKTPQAGDSLETYLGRQWQRFSWHVQKWNPARDNIITYLDTINVRLQKLE